MENRSSSVDWEAVSVKEWLVLWELDSENGSSSVEPPGGSGDRDSSHSRVSSQDGGGPRAEFPNIFPPVNPGWLEEEGPEGGILDCPPSPGLEVWDDEVAAPAP